MQAASTGSSEASRVRCSLDREPTPGRLPTTGELRRARTGEFPAVGGLSLLRGLREEKRFRFQENFITKAGPARRRQGPRACHHAIDSRRSRRSVSGLAEAGPESAERAHPHRALRLEIDWCVVQLVEALVCVMLAADEIHGVAHEPQQAQRRVHPDIELAYPVGLIAGSQL